MVPGSSVRALWAKIERLLEIDQESLERRGVISELSKAAAMEKATEAAKSEAPAAKIPAPDPIAGISMTEREQKWLTTPKEWAWLAAGILVLGWLIWPKSPHFDQEGIEKIKESIRSEWSKEKNFKVLDVQMIKESDRKLTGFVKLQMNGFDELKSLGGIFEGKVLKECTASMADNWETLWSCR